MIRVRFPTGLVLEYEAADDARIDIRDIRYGAITLTNKKAGQGIVAHVFLGAGGVIERDEFPPPKEVRPPRPEEIPHHFKAEAKK